MTRLMADSVTSGDIPQTYPMVAGYCSGPYQWSQAAWDLHPNAVQVRIATQANVSDGHVLDIESGDATAAQAPGWVARRREQGLATPCVYMSLSQWQAVKDSFQAQGVPEPLYWVAAYDNVAQIPAGAIAKQYANAPLTGGHYDLSIVADNWPGVDGEGENVANEDTALIRVMYEIAQAINLSEGMTQNQMNYGEGLIASSGGDMAAVSQNILDTSDEWKLARQTFANLRALMPEVDALQAQVGTLQDQYQTLVAEVAALQAAHPTPAPAPSPAPAGGTSSNLIPSIETAVTVLSAAAVQVQSYTGHLSGPTAAWITGALGGLLGVLKTVQQKIGG